MTGRQSKGEDSSQKPQGRLSLDVLYERFVRCHCANSLQTNEHQTQNLMDANTLMELERRVQRVLKGDANLAAYKSLILTHVATSIRGQAMETHKALYSTALANLASVYPYGCVEAFFRDWRKQSGGKWWPTASDLVRDCESRLLLWKLRHKRIRDVMARRGIEVQDKDEEQ